jgi:hypothetical protein
MREVGPAIGDLVFMGEQFKLENNKPLDHTVTLPGGKSHDINWMMAQAKQHGYWDGRSMSDLVFNTTEGRQWFEQMRDLDPTNPMFQDTRAAASEASPTDSQISRRTAGGADLTATPSPMAPSATDTLPPRAEDPMFTNPRGTSNSFGIPKTPSWSSKPPAGGAPPLMSEEERKRREQQAKYESALSGGATQPRGRSERDGMDRGLGIPTDAQRAQSASNGFVQPASPYDVPTRDQARRNLYLDAIPPTPQPSEVAPPTPSINAPMSEGIPRDFTMGEQPKSYPTIPREYTMNAGRQPVAPSQPTAPPVAPQAPAQAQTQAPPNAMSQEEREIRERMARLQGVKDRAEGRTASREAGASPEATQTADADARSAAAMAQANKTEADVRAENDARRIAANGPSYDQRTASLNKQADAMAAGTDSIGKTNRGPGEARYHQGPLAGDAKFFEGLLAKEKAEASEGDALWNERQARYRQMLKDNAANPDIKPRQPMDEEEKAMRRKSLDNRLEGRRTALKDRYDRTQQEQAARDAYAMQMQQLAMMPPEQRGQYMAAMGRNDVEMQRVNAEMQQAAMTQQQDAASKAAASKQASTDAAYAWWNSQVTPLLQGAPTDAARRAIAQQMLSNYAGEIPDDLKAKWMDATPPPAGSPPAGQAPPSGQTPPTGQTPPAGQAPARPPRPVRGADVTKLSEKLTEESTPADVHREARRILGADATPEEVGGLAASLGAGMDLNDPARAEAEARRLLEKHQQEASSPIWSDTSGGTPSERYGKEIERMRKDDADALAIIEQTLGKEKMAAIQQEFTIPWGQQRNRGWGDLMFGSMGTRPASEWGQ